MIPSRGLGGMLHALLPTDTHHGALHHQSKPTKYVDTGVALLSAAFQTRGGRRHRTHAYLCGGARMLSAPGFEDVSDIGDRNIQAARSALIAARYAITAEATGGRAGRTVRFSIATGEITIKTLKQGEWILNPARPSTPNSGGIS